MSSINSRWTWEMFVQRLYQQYPRGSMRRTVFFFTCTYIVVFHGIYVGKYIIHGLFGYRNPHFMFFFWEKSWLVNFDNSTMRDGPLEFCFQFLLPKLKKWLAQDVWLFGKFMSSNFRCFFLSLYRFHCGFSWWRQDHGLYRSLSLICVTSEMHWLCQRTQPPLKVQRMSRIRIKNPFIRYFADSIEFRTMGVMLVLGALES